MHESDSRLRIHSMVLQNMNEGVSLTDDQGIIVYTNPALDRMFGYRSGELSGKHVTVLNAYPKLENEAKVAMVINTLITKGSWVGEWHNIRKNGSTFYSRSQITALHLKNRLHFICVQEDITEERCARELTRTAESRFQALSTLLPQLIWTAGPHGENDFISQSCLEYTGTEYGGTKLQHWVDALHPEDTERAFQAWMHSINSGEPFECEYRLRRHDGVYRWFLGRAKAVRSAFGEITGWVGTATDIDDEKRRSLKH